MIDSLFCAAASMITFGAVLGKATATQMLWLTVYQVCCPASGTEH